MAKELTEKEREEAILAALIGRHDNPLWTLFLKPKLEERIQANLAATLDRSCRLDAQYREITRHLHNEFEGFLKSVEQAEAHFRKKLHREDVF